MDQNDKIVIGNNEFSLIEGLSNFKAKMFEYFPEEKAINKYIDLIKKVNSTSKSYFVKKTLPKVVEVCLSPFMGRVFLKYTKNDK